MLPVGRLTDLVDLSEYHTYSALTSSHPVSLPGCSSSLGQGRAEWGRLSKLGAWELGAILWASGNKGKLKTVSIIVTGCL